MVNSIAKRTVMAQVFQIVQNVWAILMRAVGLALKVSAISAIEMLVSVAKMHGTPHSCKMKYLYWKIHIPPSCTKQESGGSRRHR
jgi:hypothetical protein